MTQLLTLFSIPYEFLASFPFSLPGPSVKAMLPESGDADTVVTAELSMQSSIPFPVRDVGMTMRVGNAETLLRGVQWQPAPFPTRVDVDVVLPIEVGDAPVMLLMQWSGDILSYRLGTIEVTRPIPVSPPQPISPAPGTMPESGPPPSTGMPPEREQPLPPSEFNVGDIVSLRCLVIKDPRGGYLRTDMFAGPASGVTSPCSGVIISKSYNGFTWEYVVSDLFMGTNTAEFSEEALIQAITDSEVDNE